MRDALVPDLVVGNFLYHRSDRRFFLTRFGTASQSDRAAAPRWLPPAHVIAITHRPAQVDVTTHHAPQPRLTADERLEKDDGKTMS